MKYVIYIIAQIIDILNFIFLFMYPTHFVAVIIIHLLLCYLTIKCYRKFEDTIDDLPLYLIIFFPIIGGLFISLYYFSTTYFYRDNLPLSDYEQMLAAEETTTFRDQVNYEDEIRTMSYIDLLNFLGAEQKKEILINSQYSAKINNTNILKKGLESDDKEVQHYSATLLNTKENNFTNSISFLTEEFISKKNPFFLDKLVIAYKDYIDSGLIEEDSMSIFTKEYIDALNKKIEINRYDVNTLCLLFKAYIKDNDLFNAEKINRKIEIEFNQKDIVCLNKIAILFEKSDYDGIYNELENIDNKIVNSNKKLKAIKAFYSLGAI